MGRLKFCEFERLTSDEVKALAGKRPQPVIVMPSGSLEQHGPHLPLGTDAFNSTAISREIARLAGGILLPRIPYTWVGGTRSYPVAVNTPAQTALDYAAAVIRSLHSSGFRKFVVVNSHGGAIATYRLLARVMLEQGVRILVLYPPAAFSDGKPAKVLGKYEREASTLLGALSIFGRKKDVARIQKRTREVLDMFDGERPVLAPEELRTIRSWADVGFDYTHECMHVAPSRNVSVQKGVAFIRAMGRAYLPHVRAYERQVEEEEGL